MDEEEALLSAKLDTAEDIITQLRRENERYKKALKESCICGELVYINTDCPACIALKDCEELKS